MPTEVYHGYGYVKKAGQGSELVELTRTNLRELEVE
jgi:hypothetical protein